MKSGFECPYCSMVMSLTDDTLIRRYPSFDNDNSCYYMVNSYSYSDSCIEIAYYKCPNCGEYTVKAKGKGKCVTDIDVYIKPISNAKQFPNYIPQAIRNDYKEAYAFVHLTPKASATLSRRCLQGKIHDFWNIKLKNLNQEISALKDKISPDLWEAINSLRELGNIGAHMEKDTNVIVDIDENEAISLIKLIEHLMKEWYINREERNCFQIYYHQINPNKEYERKLSRILLSFLVYGYYREKSYSIEISFNQYQIRYYQYGTNLK